MALPICVNCGKRIKPREAKVAKIDKLLGKTIEHLVCPKICYAHGVANCQICDYSTGDLP